MNIRKSLIYVCISVILALSACQGPAGNQEGGTKTETSVRTRLDTLNDNIRKDSTNPENYYQRALYHNQNKDVNSALGDINKAIQLNDKQAKYFVALSDIYLDMGKIPNCIQALEKAQALDPNSNQVLLKQAKIYLILKDYQKSLNFVKTALQQDKINPEAYFIRAYAFMEMGDTSDAVRNFQVAADQNQQYYEAYVELGVLYSVKKDPLAENYLKTAININPERTDAYYLLGLYYQDTENGEKALAIYQKLLKLNPDFKEADYNSAYVYLVDKQEFDSAIVYFSRAIDLDGNYVDAYFNRGYAYELLGNYAEARKDYQKCLDIQPNYERAVDGLNRLDKLSTGN